MHADHTPTTYGLLAEFSSEEALCSAAEKVRDANYTRTDAFTPHPVHGITQALGKRKTKMNLVMLLAGITGFFIILEDQFGVGDDVDLGVASGVVETLTLRATISSSSERPLRKGLIAHGRESGSALDRARSRSSRSSGSPTTAMATIWMFEKTVARGMVMRALNCAFAEAFMALSLISPNSSRLDCCWL